MGRPSYLYRLGVKAWHHGNRWHHMGKIRVIPINMGNTRYMGILLWKDMGFLLNMGRTQNKGFHNIIGIYWFLTLPSPLTELMGFRINKIIRKFSNYYASILSSIDTDINK